MTENEKKQIDAIMQTNAEIYRLKAENARLKEENDTLKSGFDFQIRINKKINKKYVKILKYKTCLQEIKKIAEYSVMHNAKLNSNYQLILQKIAESEG